VSTKAFPARRLAFRIEYDGTMYHGWQRQPEVSPTVQGVIETALTNFFEVPCTIQGASRTDAGVHASDQIAATTISHPIRLDGFVKAVNTRLPKDIAIREAREVDQDFNPRFQNRGKTYCYRIYQSQHRRPLWDRCEWRIPWSLDDALINKASQSLMGTHDFKSFAASDGQHRTTERTITAIQWNTTSATQWTVRITGTAFLKHMVRNLVGTLVDVGRGHLCASQMVPILEARDRSSAGPTAPAHGLTLERIMMNYDEDIS